MKYVCEVYSRGYDEEQADPHGGIPARNKR